MLGGLCCDLRNLGPVCPVGSRCPVYVLHARIILCFQPESEPYGSSLQKRMNNCGSNLDLNDSVIQIPFIGFQAGQFCLSRLNGVLISAHHRSG